MNSAVPMLSVRKQEKRKENVDDRHINIWAREGHLSVIGIEMLLKAMGVYELFPAKKYR